MYICSAKLSNLFNCANFDIIFLINKPTKINYVRNDNKNLL